MTRRLFFFGIIVAALSLNPAQVSARDFVVYTTTTPMIYRYAACALASDKPTAEDQIAMCSGLRDEMAEAAERILPRFNPRERVKALRNLGWAFDGIDKDAVDSRDERKTVPPAIIAYLRCIGESVMETNDFQTGVAVDFIGIEDRCVTDHVLSVTSVRTEAELERIRLLYRRFARTGRFTDNARLGGGLATTRNGANGLSPGRSLSRSRTPVMPHYRMNQGFLALHRLPADEQIDD